MSEFLNGIAIKRVKAQGGIVASGYIESSCASTNKGVVRAPSAEKWQTVE